MELNNKVFSSAIIRTAQRHKNNLYDLLKVIPAKPLELNNVKRYSCDFIPRIDKIYVPKRRLRAKVKTVRDIRTSFENDTYAYLTRDLETQQNYLLKKIRDGSSKNENTRNIAKKILKSDAPISRSTWQMLVNLNPNNKIHPKQFVLCNGKFIQVNGSKGGNNKLICDYDIINTKIPLQVNKNKFVKDKKKYMKNGLLRNSLAIKFKPGPLGRKKYLDNSHQKYHGNIELVDLPKVGLVVQPTYGTPIEPTISNFLSILYKEDGLISAKWAEFAVSVLGKIDKSDARLINADCVTFDLKYKCDQHRILMRNDLDNLYITPSVTEATTENKSVLKDQPNNLLAEIEDMMEKILNAVEININQDNMFTADEDLSQTTLMASKPVDIVTLSKDKTKRKYSELDRLDVTVIRIPENHEKEPTQSCGNMCCSFGCICDSIKSTNHFKRHCGREECMFNCKCDFMKYNNINFLDINGSNSTELIPGIINIEDEINTRLAKEEQKFHQTVIVTGEKNILLKSEKRNWKSSKKYESFYKNMCLKNVNHGNRILSISALRLNCENVEPWCMVHNLYKCFCQGKFTTSNVIAIVPSKEPICKDADLDVECPPEKMQKLNNPDVRVKRLPRLRRYDVVNLDRTEKNDFLSVQVSDVASNNGERKRKTRNFSDISSNVTEVSKSFKNNDEEVVCLSESSDSYSFCSDYNGTCSRVIGYTGRTYSYKHYQAINYKIKEMEKNDKTLQKKIMSIANIDVENNMPREDQQGEERDIVKQKSSLDYLEKDLLTEKTGNGRQGIEKETPTEETANDHNLINFFNDIDGVTCGDEDKSSKKKLLCTENRLVGWLESNYKLYKKSIDKGLVKTSLEPPRVGKVALHSWDFILSRYRERKNLFLISKQKPYRIFMGVHTRNQFFETCMNINEIRFADLHRYPQTVKNLLTNATDLKDNFCILRGLAHCWELVGSVAKVNKTDDNAEDINDAIPETNSNSSSHFDDISNKQLSESEKTNNQSMCFNDKDSNADCPTDNESSKWFILTVENDFTEIRFYKKGFFVKYESIVKAINVARLSGKTVRLSSQKCVDKGNGPQFGIYAIPNGSEYCVFIGPYEMSDSLGIETIKSISDVGKTKKTRGFWMNTNKIDNLRVIDNPFSFMPLYDLKNNEAVPLENLFCEDKKINENEQKGILHLKEFNETQQKTLLKLDSKKMIKPIKIRKTNGFYHLAPGSLLKKVALQSPRKVILRPTLTVSTDKSTNKNLSEFLSENLSNTSSLNVSNKAISVSKDLSVTESPQIKISAVYSQRDEQTSNTSNHERGMFILKPEEINRRLFKNQLNSEATLSQEMVSDSLDENSSSKSMEYPLFQDQDLETCATLTPCNINEDICIISDDERDPSDEHIEKNNSKQVSNRKLSVIVDPSKPFNWQVIDSIDVLRTEVTPMNYKRLEEILKMQENLCSETQPLPIVLSNNIRTYSKNTASKSRASPVVESDKMTQSPATTDEKSEEVVNLVD